MTGETELTARECEEVLAHVRQRRWKQLVETKAAAKLAPLATLYLSEGETWEDTSVETRGKLIADLCQRTILDDLKAPENEDTPQSRTFIFLKYFYIYEAKVEGVKHQLGVYSAGKYQVIRKEAFETLSMVWRRKLYHQRATGAGGAASTLMQPSPESHGEVVEGNELSLPLPQQFQALIEEKTRGFVGREYVFEAVDSFLSGQPNGYFIIQGDPGVGKSAIMAEYIRRTGCIAHFNVRSQSIVRPDQFLESVCVQLINRYGLPYPSLPPDATRDSAFLGRLLDDASTHLKPGEKIVIAIDALDEVDLVSQKSGANILYLPPALPSNVYFVMTRRPITSTFVIYTPYHVLDLMEYGEESREDVQIWIRLAMDRPRLGAWIDARGIETDEFISTLADLSENNFMYLRYVLADIERGMFKDLDIERLPRGLEGYYDDHWQRMGMATRPLPRAKIKIVYVMAEVRQPVSRQLVSEFVAEDQLAVQEVLDEWEQFLHRQRLEDQVRYSLYHSSFRDFLHRKDIVQAAEVTIKDINTLIADNLWQGLFGDE